MAELIDLLVQLVVVLSELFVQLLYLALEWSLLLVWLAWALLGINWQKAWPILKQGAWAPLVLIVVLVSLVWACLFPSSYNFLGFLTVPNFWWQLGAVALVLAATLFCGWLQGVIKWNPPEIDLNPPAVEGHGHH